MSVVPRLTDVASRPAGIGRTLHGLASRSPLNFVRRISQVAAEVALAGLMDRLVPPTAGILRVAPGVAAPRGISLALYLHWSPGGQVSAMVRHQLSAWRACGFDVVFITNADPPSEDWEAAGEHCVLRIRRANTGRDFGAWRDGLSVALRDRAPPSELLLTNDSVLGPVRPLSPLVAAWRAGGEGLFGMTESWGGGVHLQSYALLARGAAAVAGVARHLGGFRDTRSKWRTVQRGELALTPRMLAEGHRCAALFGYEAACARMDTATRAALGSRFAEPSALRRYPLNPTHHLWRVLVERMGFPYLKTDLLLRNPGRLPGVEAWPSLVSAGEAALIGQHLRLMSGTNHQR